MHFNCRSINNKLDDIHDILDKAKPNILVLTETWLDDSFPKGTLSFKGYKHFRKDRSHEVKQKFKKKIGPFTKRKIEIPNHLITKKYVT